MTLNAVVNLLLCDQSHAYDQTADKVALYLSYLHTECDYEIKGNPF